MFSWAISFFILVLVAAISAFGLIGGIGSAISKVLILSGVILTIVVVLTRNGRRIV